MRSQKNYQKFRALLEMMDQTMIRREKMMTKSLKIEQRSYAFNIERRELDSGKTQLEGVPIVFGQMSDIGCWNEVIDRHALDLCDLKDVPLLTNHDINQLPVARSRNNNSNSTMQLSVMDDGMHMRADLDTDNNMRAKELDSAVSRGDISGMSFMFSVTKDSWENLDSDHPTRHILGIGKVYEVSAVTFPAYEQTSINARSLDNDLTSLDSAKATLESARKIDAMRKSVKARSEKLCQKD
jgi:HK97 family phage prohead protease